MRSRPAVRTAVAALATVCAALLALLLAGPANAAPPPRFRAVGLIADQTGKAPLVDPKLVNAWGLAMSPTGPLWVANNGTNSATVYAGGVNGATPTKAPLEVTIPGGAPTGQVFNDTAAFIIPPRGPVAGGKAVFIFASEGGDITDGAIYKGLAILRFGSTALLLAADFHHGRIDVFDAQFRHQPQYSRLFTDPTLPAGFAPFNVVSTPDGRSVYVSYAMQDADAEDEVAGGGLGFVDLFPGLRNTPQRIASRGTLNAPWGMAIAPASFGSLAGALLVGNFGDGRIGAYRGTKFVGLLHQPRGGPIAIDGLWALLPGTAGTGGTGAVWFSAGPDDEKHGLVGELLPA